MIGRTVSGHAVRIHAMSSCGTARGVTVWQGGSSTLEEMYYYKHLQSAALTPGHRVCPDSVTTHLCVFEDGILHPVADHRRVSAWRVGKDTGTPMALAGVDSVVLEARQSDAQYPSTQISERKWPLHRRLIHHKPTKQVFR
jgi:hypothetical protein